MKKILFVVLAVCALTGCTKEPKFVDVEEIMEEVLSEMDFWGNDDDTLLSDDDTLLSDEEPADGDVPLDEVDDLLSDD